MVNVAITIQRHPSLPLAITSLDAMTQLPAFTRAMVVPFSPYLRAHNELYLHIATNPDAHDQPI